MGLIFNLITTEQQPFSSLLKNHQNRVWSYCMEAHDLILFLSWSPGCFKYLTLIYIWIPVMYHSDGSAAEWVECPYLFQQQKKTLMIYNWGKCSQKLCSALRKMGWLCAEEIFSPAWIIGLHSCLCPFYFLSNFNFRFMKSYILYFWYHTHERKATFAFLYLCILKL